MFVDRAEFHFVCDAASNGNAEVCAYVLVSKENSSSSVALENFLLVDLFDVNIPQIGYKGPELVLTKVHEIFEALLVHIDTLPRLGDELLETHLPIDFVRHVALVSSVVLQDIRPVIEAAGYDNLRRLLLPGCGEIAFPYRLVVFANEQVLKAERKDVIVDPKIRLQHMLNHVRPRMPFSPQL